MRSDPRLYGPFPPALPRADLRDGYDRAMDRIVSTWRAQDACRAVRRETLTDIVEVRPGAVIAMPERRAA